MKYALYSSTAIALIFYFADVFTKKQKYYPKYILLFFTAYLITFSLHGKADEFRPHFTYELYKDAITYHDYEYYENEVWEHLSNAEECIEEAEKICLYMPCTTDKEKAEYCLKTFLAGCVPNSPHIKLITMALIFLTDYIPSCIDQWHRLVYLVEKAKYHYEMAIFYNNILAREGESQF